MDTSSSTHSYQSKLDKIPEDVQLRVGMTASIKTIENS